MYRGKRRTHSQRIGKKGESLFVAWAPDRRLTTTKPDEDFGIDYFCQVFSPILKQKVDEITGQTLMVQVRTTEDKRTPRITLNNTDAVNLLRQKHATCLFGVDLFNKNIYYQFINETFIDKLVYFISSSKSTMSIRLSEMQKDVIEFDKQLIYYTTPGVLHRMEIYKAEKQLSLSIPNSSLELLSTSKGGQALVKVPWLYAVFNIDPTKREEIRSLVIEKGLYPIEKQGVILKPEFDDITALVDGQIYVVGMIEREVNVMIQYDDNKETVQFRYRKMEDEKIFTHPCGISFIISGRRVRDGVAIHELESRVFESEISIGRACEIIPFLRLLKPGAYLSIENSIPIMVDKWGASIVRIGSAIDALTRIIDELKLDNNDYYLNDFKSDEFGRSIGFLDLFILDKKPLDYFFKGFIYGQQNDIAINRIPTKSVYIEIPVVLNIKDKGILLNIKMDGELYINEQDQIIGLKFNSQDSWLYNISTRYNKSIYPELWVNKHWPPVKLGAELESHGPLSEVGPEYIKHEVRIYDK